MPKVGDTVWMFDSNVRVYGPGRGGPIWERHWVPLPIIGQTSRSWLAGYSHDPYKVPKKDHDPRKWAFSKAAIARQAWVIEHRTIIARAVATCDDYALLMKVQELLTR